MPEFSAHYCHGSLTTAFILSVPGALENSAGKPVSGDTGTNLDAALVLLNSANPTLFPSTQRYDYRITNAFAEPRAKALGHKSSEAKISEIRTNANVARVVKEVSGCRLVLLCGKKAQLLSARLEECGKQVIRVAHPGHRGLNQAFRVVSPAATETHRARRRVELWVQTVLTAIAHF